MEEKKETRGRKATGQKVYKQVGFRLEEAKFDIYEKLAQEKGVESLSTYIRNNIDKLFVENKKYNIEIPAHLIYFMDFPELMTGFMSEKFEVFFKEEFFELFFSKTMEQITKYLSKGVKNQEELKRKWEKEPFKEIRELWNIWGSVKENYVKDKIQSLLEGKIKKLLEEHNLEMDKIFKEYYLEYKPNLDTRKMPF